jgi:hypothetical protein
VKAGTSTSPKVRRLARKLGVPRVHAIGILALLWEFTAGHAPRGDVGRWDDEDIADACDWPEDQATELISALIETRWLDECPENRLIVHDWADHCPQYIKKRLDRTDEQPLAGPKSNGISDEPERQTTGAERETDSAERRPTKARQGKASQGKAGRGKAEPPPSPWFCFKCKHEHNSGSDPTSLKGSCSRCRCTAVAPFSKLAAVPGVG